MRDVSWSPDLDKACVLLPGSISCSGHSALIYSILSSNLSQVNHISNSQGRSLDLVFCTDPDNVTVRDCLYPLSRVDAPFHGVTEFQFTIADHSSMKSNDAAFFYDVKNADFDALSEYFARTDWNFAFVIRSTTRLINSIRYWNRASNSLSPFYRRNLRIILLGTLEL